MTIVRWNPWKEFDILNHQLSRLFDDALTTGNWQDFSQMTTVPAAELLETDEAIYLKLELPGIDADALDIQATEKSIAIRGERQSETKSEADGVTRSEFRYGKFQRVVPLPDRIRNTEVTADYKDGILHLTLPKAVVEQSKVVKVRLGSEAA
ncbi:MAG: Hsp20/alpha crystallin family protein [Acaryochloridaceae cyanobacterium SU_2_1]|nr:Hsp20/alpha crystallin family protein [Acaryochloridaceae cyanobacterium SU_2_1]